MNFIPALAIVVIEEAHLPIPRNPLYRKPALSAIAEQQEVGRPACKRIDALLHDSLTDGEPVQLLLVS